MNLDDDEIHQHHNALIENNPDKMVEINLYITTIRIFSLKDCTQPKQLLVLNHRPLIPSHKMQDLFLYFINKITLILRFNLV